jgi:protein-S-isoprenylcysteine O-methyltransferase Ste14
MFANEFTFRTIALILLATMMVIRRRTQGRSDRAGQREALQKNAVDTGILRVFGMSWTLSVVVYALTPEWISWAQLDFAMWIRWMGVAIGLGSLVLLAWSDHHLGVNFSPTLRIRERHELVKNGPYRWVRHPIYTSGLMFMIAIQLISSNWFVGLCWSGVIVLYAQRIPREERMMLKRFGKDYQDYQKQTGCLWPRMGIVGQR